VLRKDTSPGGNEFHSYSAHGITHDWYFYIILNLRDYHVGLDNDHPVYSPYYMYNINGIYICWLDATSVRSFWFSRRKTTWILFL